MSVEQMPQQRIDDGQRERAVARLGEHVGAGRLDLDEFSARSEQVYAARTRAELDAVFSDLPRPSRRPSEPGRPDAARGHAVAMRATWGSWLLTGVICLVIWAAVSLGQGAADYFWPIWVIGPWGAMLAVFTVTGGAACRDRHPHRTS